MVDYVKNGLRFSSKKSWIRYGIKKNSMGVSLSHSISWTLPYPSLSLPFSLSPSLNPSLSSTLFDSLCLSLPLPISLLLSLSITMNERPNERLLVRQRFCYSIPLLKKAPKCSTKWQFLYFHRWQVYSSQANGKPAKLNNIELWYSNYVYAFVCVLFVEANDSSITPLERKGRVRPRTNGFCSAYI